MTDRELLEQLAGEINNAQRRVDITFAHNDYHAHVLSSELKRELNRRVNPDAESPDAA